MYNYVIMSVYVSEGGGGGSESICDSPPHSF